MSKVKCPVCEYPIIKKRADIFCSETCKHKNSRNNIYLDGIKHLSEKELQVRQNAHKRKLLEYRFTYLKIKYEKELRNWLIEMDEKGIAINKDNFDVWLKFILLNHQIFNMQSIKESYDKIPYNEFDFEEFKASVFNRKSEFD